MVGGGGTLKSMSRIVFNHTYEDIISVENLLAAWREFLKGKRRKRDVREFQYQLADNILSLHRDLVSQTYRHGGYYAFNISDPKPRNIHKALVRDRLLHHALYRKLYPFFDKTFISNSYSCRKYKGTHRAVRAFKRYIARAGRNDTKTVWVLKCDIKKFFASVDQRVLFEILQKRIQDANILRLAGLVVESFSSTVPGKGLPLGNLTSQLLVNVYMNEFDQFMKHKLKAKYYIRYADDFVVLSGNKKELEQTLRYIVVFLRDKLKLRLHPNKVSISTIASGVDFLGWVHFPDHRVLRAMTKRRMFRVLADTPKLAQLVSYQGMLTHGNTHGLSETIEMIAKRAYL
ncbi:MAG: Retron-type reverse transcriptase [Parcubacteria group bacterium GW2011_GWA1_47_11]|nr:MAG: Retron-type reverse transcriptase [Parcubacteria group bacterium GW2011_GWA1_47_11]